MALKVIGAGFGRTGTLSMKAALERLGYTKCHHMVDVMPNGAQVDHWRGVGLGETPDWDAIFAGYQASVDFPSSAYYRELAAHYPDAKVVLTIRSFESWYESATNTIYAIGKAVPGWMKLLPRPKKIQEMVDGIIWDGLFDGRFEDRAHAEKVFTEHIEAVKAAIPPDRLLVMEVKDGWGPLCAFLGHETPDEPFPRVNDTAEFRKRIALLQRLAWAPWALGAVIAAAAAYIALT